MAHRLATASAPKGSGTSGTPTKSVIIIPVLNNSERVEGFWISESLSALRRVLYSPICLSSFFEKAAQEFDSEARRLKILSYNRSYSRSYRVDERGLIPAFSFDTREPTIKGIVALDLPETHQVFVSFRDKDASVYEAGILFANRADKPWYRSVTRDILVRLENNGALSNPVESIFEAKPR